MEANHYSADFIGDKEYTSSPKIKKIPCRYCKAGKILNLNKKEKWKKEESQRWQVIDRF